MEHDHLMNSTFYEFINIENLWYEMNLKQCIHCSGNEPGAQVFLLSFLKMACAKHTHGIGPEIIGALTPTP
jgi:hypothetical protein